MVEDAAPARPTPGADLFEEAWRTRDLDGWVESMAPDVVLHSPLISTPFHGRASARDLYGVLFEAFGKMTITHRSSSGETVVVGWRGELGNGTVEGLDLLRYHANGLIVEIRVLMRPLVALGRFAAVVGPDLGRRKGRTNKVAVWVLTRPLGPLFRAVDRLSPALLPLGAAPGLTAGQESRRLPP
jgi:hypothetical protein